MVLPFAIVNPTLAGEISSGRSIIAISCSMGLPGTTSATNFIVHFIRPELPHPTTLHALVGSEDAFPDDLPAVLKDTVDRLDRLIADATEESERSKATRALARLYKLLQNQHATGGLGL